VGFAGGPGGGVFCGKVSPHPTTHGAGGGKQGRGGGGTRLRDEYSRRVSPSPGGKRYTDYAQKGGGRGGDVFHVSSYEGGEKKRYRTTH